MTILDEMLAKGAPVSREERDDLLELDEMTPRQMERLPRIRMEDKHLLAPDAPGCLVEVIGPVGAFLNIHYVCFVIALDYGYYRVGDVQEVTRPNTSALVDAVQYTPGQNHLTKGSGPVRRDGGRLH